MRLAHALLALATIAVSYGLFRQLLSRGWAAFAACVLGSSHALLMVSRMAMRENTAVLAEVTALALLVGGLRRDDPLLSFCGGLAAGLGFYVDFPGRATFLAWLLFLAGLGLFRSGVPLRRLARLGALGPPVSCSRQHRS
jgi:hypothetical protein